MPRRYSGCTTRKEMKKAIQTLKKLEGLLFGQAREDLLQAIEAIEAIEVQENHMIWRENHSQETEG